MIAYVVYNMCPYCEITLARVSVGTIFDPFHLYVTFILLYNSLSNTVKIFLCLDFEFKK